VRARIYLRQLIVGIAVMACFAGPGVVAGIVGVALWGSAGALLFIAPYIASALLLAAWFIGSAITGAEL
jgi:hypothetical protein